MQDEWRHAYQEVLVKNTALNARAQEFERLYLESIEKRKAEILKFGDVIKDIFDKAEKILEKAGIPRPIRDEIKKLSPIRIG